MLRRLKTILFCLLATLLLVSCKAGKKVVNPVPPQPFEWLVANTAIQVEGNGMSFDDLSGQLRMRRDSLVWLSVTATMGVEVLRAKVSNDSVWVLNRMDKTYLAEPIDTVAARLGMPFSLPWVQTLLLDNNEGLPPVENQTVQLRTFVMGDLSAKMKYTKVKEDETTSFPLKITDKMQRVRLPKMQ